MNRIERYNVSGFRIASAFALVCIVFVVGFSLLWPAWPTSEITPSSATAAPVTQKNEGAPTSGENKTPSETLNVRGAGQQNSSQPPIEKQSSARSGDTHTGWQLLVQLAGPLVTLVAATVAFFSFRWSVKNWRLTFFTKEWTSLIEFLKNEAKFMDPSKNREYRAHFVGEDLIKYDLIARLCIGYLDDLYYLGSKHEMCTYFRGSIRLFGDTHRSWLKDNMSAYDRSFYDFIVEELGKNDA
jgi:hypothetical protein